MIEKMPFGKTGHQSARLLFGAAAVSDVTQSVADQTLQVLLRYGVNHIDVAASYGDAELRVGPWMKSWRSGFFLATKTEERSREKAGLQIRRSLERLQTDHLDLIQLHAVTSMEELDAALRSGGALEAALEARTEGLVRFIGITSHGLQAPAVLTAALERFDFSSVLLPYNFPMMQNPGYAGGFRRLADLCARSAVAIQTIKAVCRRPWPTGAKRNTTTWYETLTDGGDIQTAVHFVLGQPQLFLNSVSDVTLLPKVLESADRYKSAPADSEMRALVSAKEMLPLWQ